MSEISFEVEQSALAVVRDTVISANFDECRGALEEMMAPYASLVVTEDGIAAAKADRAKIRKVSDRIDEVRKTVKKAYTEPLTAFEARCKELTGICQTAAANLDGQVKEFENREKAEKIARLRAVYDVANEGVREYLPWERLYNPKWENKGYAEDTAAAEINAALHKVLEDLAAIRSVGGEDVAYLLDFYRQGHDLGAVLRKGRELADMRAAEAARKVAEAASKRKETGTRIAPPPCATARNDNDIAPQGNGGAAEPERDEAIHILDFRVHATAAQLDRLKAFLLAECIEYGPVPSGR